MALGLSSGPRVWGKLPADPHLWPALGLGDDCGRCPPALQGQEQRRDFIASIEASTSTCLGFYLESEAFDSRLCHLRGDRAQRGQPASGLDRCGEPSGQGAKQTATGQHCSRLAGKSRWCLAASRQFPTPGHARPRQWRRSESQSEVLPPGL